MNTMNHAARCRGFSRAVLLLVLAGLAIGAVIVWHALLQDHFIPKRWETVAEGCLYRSAQLSTPIVEETWREHNIKVVLNLGRDKPGNLNHEAHQRAASELGIDRRMYKLDGNGTGDPEIYVQVLKAIVEASRQGKPVHVHCSGGVFRTGGATALYRVFFQGWNGHAVYKELTEHGVEDTAENMLIPYLNQNMAYIARRLEETSSISKAPVPLPILEPEQTR